jgi:ABC-type multidrug transport system fused ATPase/permease subunit
LSFCYTISIHLLFLLKRYVSLEQSMVALERIEEYSTLPREAPEFIEPRPPSDWPQAGHIKCDNLTVRYAQDLPDVLHGVSFEVKPGEKVGVLGRTGSGKSTLALSFLRLVEPLSGTIVVDGVNIRSIGLSDLRSNITIIPQDPAILSGTLRSVLDVFDEHDDAQIVGDYPHNIYTGR